MSVCGVDVADLMVVSLWVELDLLTWWSRLCV